MNKEDDLIELVSAMVLVTGLTYLVLSGISKVSGIVNSMLVNF